MENQHYVQVMGHPVDDDYVGTPPPKLQVLDARRRQEYDELLRVAAIQICSGHKVPFQSLHPVARVFMTHYRCMSCGLRPLYCLNLKTLNRVTCGVCGSAVSFNSSGKYGKMRKRIALSLLRSPRRLS